MNKQEWLQNYPSFDGYYEQRAEIERLHALVDRLRERIDVLNDKVEFVREQRDGALMDLWKVKVISGYWHVYAQRVQKQKDAWKKRALDNERSLAHYNMLAAKRRRWRTKKSEPATESRLAPPFTSPPDGDQKGVTE